MLTVHGIDEVLDATVQENCARFANQHCTPNAKYYMVRLPNSPIYIVFSYEISQLATGDEVYVD